ncbi:hypothetical protein DOTSEDRAFT_37812 [Dothistroma septosporum NZE10]|uniref:Uncharacterized protein n=1 Tax=Dothistroma septosporum (strain NZE10 / CBS 128990) TaxID=675120 RepID=N1PG82_DOTSN|nr:hypothetical protein DOTSEDRAFT_37812 [Dothistroma septosporum NZE10]
MKSFYSKPKPEAISPVRDTEDHLQINHRCDSHDQSIQPSTEATMGQASAKKVNAQTLTPATIRRSMNSTTPSTSKSDHVEDQDAITQRMVDEQLFRELYTAIPVKFKQDESKTATTSGVPSTFAASSTYIPTVFPTSPLPPPLPLPFQVLKLLSSLQRDLPLPHDHHKHRCVPRKNHQENHPRYTLPTAAEAEPTRDVEVDDDEKNKQRKQRMLVVCGVVVVCAAGHADSED